MVSVAGAGAGAGAVDLGSQVPGRGSDPETPRERAPSSVGRERAAGTAGPAAGGEAGGGSRVSAKLPNGGSVSGDRAAPADGWRGDAEGWMADPGAGTSGASSPASLLRPSPTFCREAGSSPGSAAPSGGGGLGDSGVS